MKFWLITTVCCALVLVVAGFASPRLIRSAKNGELMNGVNQVKQLTLSLQEFERNTGAFPEKLSSLVAPDYLSRDDYENLIGGIQIEYIPPITKPFEKNHILLIGRLKDYKICGAVSGEVRWMEVR